jgi:hypothetical protein
MQPCPLVSGVVKMHPRTKPPVFLSNSSMQPRACIPFLPSFINTAPLWSYGCSSMHPIPLIIHKAYGTSPVICMLEHASRPSYHSYLSHRPQYGCSGMHPVPPILYKPYRTSLASSSMHTVPPIIYNQIIYCATPVICILEYASYHLFIKSYCTLLGPSYALSSMHPIPAIIF